MKILIIAAHPDDEVLGCFGTVSKLIKEGHEAYTLILGEGKTSRGENNLNELKKEAIKANKLIGIKEIFFKNFPDNKFDSIPLLDVIKEIEIIKNLLKPDIIFTHSKHDLNIDHRITYDATITATRPLTNESVKSIFSFEILSSTEWNYPLNFSPNYYVNIENSIEDKIKAMSFYKSELRDYPHPRSLDGIKLRAKNHGINIGCKYAEAFEIVRMIHC